MTEVKPTIFFLLTTFCLTGFNHSVFAQTAVVKVEGYVNTDHDFNDSVYISLLDAGKGFLIGTQKRPAGKFVFKAQAGKSLKVQVVADKYETYISDPIETNCDTCIIHLDTIRLKYKVVTLDEVTVTARKSLIEDDIDKLNYNVEDDPDAPHSSLLDIMRKVPLINISGTDKVSVNGKAILVLVNGKRSGLFKRNVGTIMKSFPAHLVKKVEVITNPSAKYDAEGVGAIINVVLTKKKFDGYNAHISAGLTTRESAAGVATIIAKAGKWGLNSYIGPTRSHYPERTVHQYIRYTKPEDFSSDQETGIRNLYKSFAFHTEVSYEPDSLNLFTVDFSDVFDKRNSSVWLHSQLLDEEPAVYESFYAATRQLAKIGGPEISLSYQRSFKDDPDRIFSVLYQYNKNVYSETDTQIVSGLVNYSSGTNRWRNREKESEQTVQIDYTQTLWKNEFEVGVKSINRNYLGDYYYDLFDKTSSPIPLDGTFNLVQSVNAAYATYALRFKKFSFRMGFREEWTKNNINRNTATEYFTAIPTVSILTKVLGSTIRFSYSKRIERPGLSYLNPAPDLINNRFVFSGNPNLTAEKGNSLEFSFNGRMKKTNIRSTVNYLFSNNSIQSVIWTESDSISRRSFFNIGSYRLFSFNQFVSAKLHKTLTQTVKFTIYHRTYSMLPEYKNSGWSFFGSYSLNFRNQKSWRAAFDFSYTSSAPTLQGKMQDRFSHYILVGKGFLNDKLYAGISLRNFFPARLVVESDFSGTNFFQQNISREFQREVSFNIEFSFGRLKERLPRQDKSIENTDKKRLDKKEKPNTL